MTSSPKQVRAREINWCKVLIGGAVSTPGSILKLLDRNKEEACELRQKLCELRSVAKECQDLLRRIR